MREVRPRNFFISVYAFVLCTFALTARGGGSGLNTLVVVNQNSPNSVELGNYYCERRQIPPENVLRITWTGGNIGWSSDEWQTNLVTPMINALATRQLTNQIDYVVLSMDIPYETANGTYWNGTTSALFYGLKNDSSKNMYSSYALSEQVFRSAKPTGNPGYSFLATIITGDTLDGAKRLVDQGVNSDSTFPNQPVLLAKSSDPIRNIRYSAFDNVAFNTRLAGNYTVLRTNMDSPLGLSNLFGFQTGLEQFSMSPNSFIPGAMADSLTSYGGIIFGHNDQTSLMALINAGAAGSYGTVSEPGAVIDKFALPMNYFYQARGFTLAECYYQSVKVPYQGIVVGDPLAAPCQLSGVGTWLGIASNAVLTGTASLSVAFTAANPGHPLQQLDLFVDGKFSRTLTNIAPAAGNTLTFTLNNSPLSYVVPVNANLMTIASNVTLLLNSPANPNASSMVASLYGDRIEVQATRTNRVAAPGKTVVTNAVSAAGTNLSSLVSSSAGSASYLSTFLLSSRNTFLNSQAFGTRTVTVNGVMNIGTWLQLNVTKLNGTHVSIAVTNQSSTASPFDLATQMTNTINANSGLQSADGVVAEDLTLGGFGTATFTLRARAAGYTAAQARANLTASSGLVISPSGDARLNDNLADMQPRHHLYVKAGITTLPVSFLLDTRALVDGYHELTAVAYEGSHVRTQTRTTIPIRVQNSPLSATLTTTNLLNPSPASGTYQVQVTANTNNVSTIQLFTTGGLLNTISNQANATFTISGSNLGAGLHPFVAVIQTTAGVKYRTQPLWVRLTGP